MADFVRFILILYSSIFGKHTPQSIRFAYDSLSISRHDTRIFDLLVKTGAETPQKQENATL